MMVLIKKVPWSQFYDKILYFILKLLSIAANRAALKF
jgi:hypothetical protein